ncbi:hypothetical protein PGT21_004581 [Puccinia graminis f. sp. tritici]|uniref:Uncharacterized protein n=1 Tax=Puccinia graminis f. sp. tritici TaxID=56615 RepID=A0A5B0NT97_PUCGR|nr:hypothetical protein PGT21_004581 [Puccinia graminis f. sp. tritici]
MGHSLHCATGFCRLFSSKVTINIIPSSNLYTVVVPLVPVKRHGDSRFANLLWLPKSRGTLLISYLAKSLQSLWNVGSEMDLVRPYPPRDPPVPMFYIEIPNKALGFSWKFQAIIHIAEASLASRKSYPVSPISTLTWGYIPLTAHRSFGVLSLTAIVRFSGSLVDPSVTSLLVDEEVKRLAPLPANIKSKLEVHQPRIATPIALNTILLAHSFESTAIIDGIQKVTMRFSLIPSIMIAGLTLSNSLSSTPIPQNKLAEKRIINSQHTNYGAAPSIYTPGFQGSGGDTNNKSFPPGF